MRTLRTQLIDHMLQQVCAQLATHTLAEHLSCRQHARAETGFLPGTHWFHPIPAPAGSTDYDLQLPTVEAIR